MCVCVCEMCVCVCDACVCGCVVGLCCVWGAGGVRCVCGVDGVHDGDAGGVCVWCLWVGVGVCVCVV